MGGQPLQATIRTRCRAAKAKQHAAKREIHALKTGICVVTALLVLFSQGHHLGACARPRRATRTTMVVGMQNWSQARMVPTHTSLWPALRIMKIQSKGGLKVAGMMKIS